MIRCGGETGEGCGAPLLSVDDPCPNCFAPRRDFDMTNQRVKLARCRDGQNHIDPKECPAYNSDLREQEPVYVRAEPVAQALAHEHSWSRGRSHSHPGAHTWHSHRDRNLDGELIDLAAAAAGDPGDPGFDDRGFGPVIADTSIDEPHEDTLYDDPVDIPAEAPLPPRTITVEPPEGDDWIERYGETVSHGCQRTDVHTLAECRDWPCPNTSQDECLMVRERYAARTHSDVIPPCVHHDDVGGREGPERGIE